MGKIKQYHGGLPASVHETAEGLTGAGVMRKLLALVAKNGLNGVG